MEKFNLNNLKNKNTFIIFSFFIFGLIMIFSTNVNLNTTNPSSDLSSVGLSRPTPSDFATNGETITYVPLIRSSGGKDLLSGGGDNLASLLLTLFRWGLSISIVLAVLFIIKGGIQYTVTDSISGKATGKETIKSAIIGLILALSSYLILNTVNPQLLKLDITQGDNINLNPPGGTQ